MTMTLRFSLCASKLSGDLLIFLTCFFIVPLVFSAQLIMDDEVFLPHGELWRLSCHIEGSNYSNITSKDLQFLLGGKPTPYKSELANSTTRILLIENLSKGKHVFYCIDKVMRMVALTNVYVGLHPPSDVSDFKCISKNFEKLTCSFRYEADLITKFNLTYVVNGAETKNCIMLMNGSFMSCSWTQNTKPVYRREEKRLTFNLVGFNKLGSNNQTFYVDHYSIIKLDPPEIDVLKSSPHDLFLNWTLHTDLVNYANEVDLLIKIEYQIPRCNSTFHEVEIIKTKNFTNAYRLSELPYANTNYKVRISAKIATANDEYWSEPTKKTFLTQSERPKRPPYIPTGAFDNQVYDKETQRRLYVYWKQLEEYEEAGADFEYIYKLNDSTKTIAAGNKGYFKLLSESADAINVFLWSKNLNGSSEKNSHLYIPAYEDTNVIIEAFTTFSYENGTFVLSWKNRENVDNYTLFWCVQNEPRICKDRINFTYIDSFKNEYVLHLPTAIRYQFALSANKDDKSSGMKWPKCELSKSTIALSEFPITLECTDVGSNYINLTWSLDCIFNESIITGYNITYFPLQSYESHLSYKYISDPKETTAVISKLDPFTNYSFVVNVDTIFGLSSKNKSCLIQTLQDTPPKPNFEIKGITNDTILINLKPLNRLNGNVMYIKFIIYDNDTEIYRENAKCTHGTLNNNIQCDDIAVSGLPSYTNHWISMRTYNSHIDHYSEPTEKVYVKTKIGTPGLTFLKYSDLKNSLYWDPPKTLGGRIDFYEIKIKTDDEESIIATNESSYPVNRCEDRTYYIRAVNIDKNSDNGSVTFFQGPWSTELNRSCNRSIWSQQLFAVLGGIASIILIFASLKAYKIIEERKKIDVILPPGLTLSTKKSDGVFDKTDNALLEPLNHKAIQSSDDVKYNENTLNSSGQCKLGNRISKINNNQEIPHKDQYWKEQDSWENTRLAEDTKSYNTVIKPVLINSDYIKHNNIFASTLRNDNISKNNLSNHSSHIYFAKIPNIDIKQNKQPSSGRPELTASESPTDATTDKLSKSSLPSGYVQAGFMPSVINGKHVNTSLDKIILAPSKNIAGQKQTQAFESSKRPSEVLSMKPSTTGYVQVSKIADTPSVHINANIYQIQTPITKYHSSTSINSDCSLSSVENLVVKTSAIDNVMPPGYIQLSLLNSLTSKTNTDLDKP